MLICFLRRNCPVIISNSSSQSFCFYVTLLCYKGLYFFCTCPAVKCLFTCQWRQQTLHLQITLLNLELSHPPATAATSESCPCDLVSLEQSWQPTRILHLSRSTDTCVGKKALGEDEALIQILY